MSWVRFSHFLFSFGLLVGYCCISDALECGISNKRRGLLDWSPMKCPGIFDDKDETFCCENKDGSFRCCEFDEFAKNQGIMEYVIPVVIGVAVTFLACCLICCLCCPCCMLYKRRHRGTVYGRVQQPQGTVVSVHSYPVVPPGGTPQMQPSTLAPVMQPMQQPMPMPMPMPMPQTGGSTSPYPMYPAYPPQPDPSQMPPPPYSAAVTKEGYAQQAAYNPNY